jgi:Na+/H+-translocating membrane pyrophosphatase
VAPIWPVLGVSMAHTVAGKTFEMHELFVAALVGSIFGMLGFFITQHITKGVEKLI